MDASDYYREKICIVTGANSGIGFALSEELLKRGATVYMLGRDPAKVAGAAGKLSSHGSRVRTLVADVTEQQQVQAAVEGAAAEAGRLDMLFNNAGIFRPQLYETATLGDWQTMIETNLWSVIYGVHAALPIMLRQGSGHVVNTASVAGLDPFPMQEIYNTTKYAVVGLSESLRYGFAEKGIAFSVICPGDIATPIYSKVTDREGRGTETPAHAYPADAAATYSLDRVAERKGIVVVPEQPYTDLWRGYVVGDPGVEAMLVRMAHDRRVLLETRGTYI
ncbi:MAG: SDR family oxidoreductase [Methanospirillum sp.]|nr:SDR family oxidoreductase [Methanospirillum sp.]